MFAQQRHRRSSALHRNCNTGAKLAKPCRAGMPLFRVVSEQGFRAAAGDHAQHGGGWKPHPGTTWDGAFQPYND
jgi:hypothetical protein